MTYTLAEIAEATGLSLVGDGSITVSAPSEPALAGPDSLALAMDDRMADALSTSKARAAVVWQDADWSALGLQAALLAPRPRVALAGVTAHFQAPVDMQEGVHPTACVAPSAELGPDVWIGPFTVIADGAQIGAGSRIASNCTIGRDAVIGDRALLHPGVRIGARCVIGTDFIAQPNAVIGADGFSFEPPERGSVEAAKETGRIDGARASGFLRIHSLAAVEIGDDVEIGAATTIDRGTITPTRIGSGTKIDNQVQIGHNVTVGQTCLLCAQTGIAGSTTIGDRVVMGGKAGVAAHVTVGSDVVCAAGTMVAGNLPPNQVYLGIPAQPRNQAAKQIVALKRLPNALEQLSQIRKKLGL
ncbi:MAG: UDP-3-O-(3-hydroxymyristoyl)glucosamine N-acyltransferase [Paracoccaceae bacterium]